MSNINLPSREEQDALAERIRVTRIAARVAIVRAGGVGLAAYLGALQLSVKPPKPTKNGKAGSILRGCHSRPAAGVHTQDAIALLTAEVIDAATIQAAATLDLDCDPGCRAIDKARDALIELLVGDGGGFADVRARGAIRDFDRTVGLAVAALYDVGPVMVRIHRRVWTTQSNLGRSEAIAAAHEGLRKACTVYRPGGAGDTSLATYARRSGWMGKAICEAETLARSSAAAHMPPGSTAHRSAEEEAIDMETECLYEDKVLALLDLGVQQVTGRDTASARGIRALAAGRPLADDERKPTSQILRSLWKRSAAQVLAY